MKDSRGRFGGDGFQSRVGVAIVLMNHGPPTVRYEIPTRQGSRVADLSWLGPVRLRADSRRDFLPLLRCVAYFRKQSSSNLL